MVVLGCAALALWTAPAMAAESPVPAPVAEPAATAPAEPTPAAVDAASDVQESSATAAAPDVSAPDAPASAPAPDPTALSAAAASGPEVTPVQVPTAAPSNLAATATRQAVAPAAPTVPATVTTGMSQPSAGQVVSGGHPVEGTLGHATRSSNVNDSDPRSNLQGFADDAGGGPLSGPARPGLAGEAPSPPTRHTAAAPDRPLQLLSFLTERYGAASGSSGTAASTRANGDGPVPAHPTPGPLQLPGLGSDGGSNTSSNGFFFFAFAILLGLLVLVGQALSKRLRSAPASWRPVPFVALLERPG